MSLSKATLVELERKRLAREQAEDDRQALIRREKFRAMCEATELLKVAGFDGMTGRKGQRTDNYNAHRRHDTFKVVPIAPNMAFKRGSYR